MNHQPWDDGVISDVFAGLVAPNKTTKTQCGVRVALSKANHTAIVTCPACIAEMARRERGRAILTEYGERLERDGFDAANEWSKSLTVAI